MNIWATIFGGGDVISKGMDLLDDLHTSAPEMLEAKTKAKADLMQAYAPFKVAQRYLAVMFALTFISSFALVLGMTLYDGGDTDDVATILNQFYIGEIMLAIVMFYFGGGMAEGILAKRAGK